MKVFVEEKTLSDSDFDECDEFSDIKGQLHVFCKQSELTFFRNILKMYIFWKLYFFQGLNELLDRRLMVFI